MHDSATLFVTFFRLPELGGWISYCRSPFTKEISFVLILIKTFHAFFKTLLLNP
jgi:hypothetical protein